MTKIPAATLLVVLVGVFGSCGDDDKPVGPTEPKDYYVYLNSQSAQTSYWRYHTGSGEIERFELPYNSMECGFAISPHGKYMYLYPDGFLVTVSLDSLTVISEEPIAARHTGFPFPPELQVSPSGRYLALIHRNLNILDLSDNSVIYSDTTGYYSGRFCGGMDVFLAGARDSGGWYALQVDLRASVDTQRTYFSNISVAYIQPDRWNTKWFILSSVSRNTWRFTAYERASDSVLFADYMCPPPADIEISPNDDWVAYCQPSTWQMTCPAPCSFTFYDVANNRIQQLVEIPKDSVPYTISIFRLCITPDGRHVIGTAWEPGPVFDYDPVNDRYDRFLQGHISPWFLECQSER